MISRTPCGLGVNVITATLEYIDGVGGILGSAGPTAVYVFCPVSEAFGAAHRLFEGTSRFFS